MTNKAPRTGTGSVKPRRSRRGCRNCKLRKVKCDELRPHCQGCKTYGVLCNYDANVRELQQSAEAQPQNLLGNGSLAARKASRVPCLYARVSILDTGATRDFTVPFALDPKRTELLYHFRNCMGPIWRTAGDGCVQLAHEYPFLMHAILAVGNACERHLRTSSSNVPSRRTISEISNFSRSTSLLVEQLGSSIPPQAKDAIWTTGALYGALLFVAADAPSIEDAWPLRSSGACDLDWIRMVDAKWTLWKFTDPMRPDGIFRCLMDTYAAMRVDAPPKGAEGVPPSLARLCDLSEQSTSENNPYFDAVHVLSWFDGPPESRGYVAKVFAFLTCTSQLFKALLARRDARALLLLLLWYEKASQAAWWIDLRGRVERPAIRLYLRRYHSHDTGIQELLPNQ